MKFEYINNEYSDKNKHHLIYFIICFVYMTYNNFFLFVRTIY